MDKSLAASSIVEKTAIPLLTMALALALPATVSARDFNQRIYIGGNVGLSKLKPRTTDTGFGVDDDKGTGGSLTAGYDLSKRLSIEGFFSKLGEAGISNDQTGNHAGEIDYDYGGVSAIGYVYNNRDRSDYPGGDDDEGYYRREGFSVYGRVGTGKLNTSSSNLVHRQRKSWDLHLGIGVEFGWSNGFATRAEFVSFDKDAKFFSFGIIKRFGSHPTQPVSIAPPTPPAMIQKPVKQVKAPKITPPKKPQIEAAKIELPTILFGFDQASLRPEAQSKLDTVANTLSKNRGLKLEVSGHTDSVGAAQYNEKLGLKRAKSATRYLIDKGIESTRLEPVSYGERKPAADNSTETGRRLNRRVEFEVK